MKGITNNILSFFSWVFKIYFGLCFFGTLLILYPFFHILLSKEKWHPTAFKLKRIWAHILLTLLLSPVIIKGKENIPKNTSFIICANHTSYIDIIVMYITIPSFFLFMGKSELLNWPLFNIFFKKMDIAVHRYSARLAAIAYDESKIALETGKSIAIFPEGTIPNHPPKLKSFKNGAFKLAVETQKPIVPISFFNHYKVLGKINSWKDISRPGILKVKIHPPIHHKPTGGKELIHLRNQVYEILNQDQIGYANYR